MLIRIILILAVLIFSPCKAIAQPEMVAFRLMDITDQMDPVINIINLPIDKLWHQGRYEEIFPLFYLITRLDPYDEEAWSTGGWFLINCIAPAKPISEKKKWQIKGIEFLKEGLKYNDNTYRLYWELAWIYYQWGELETAIEYLDNAINFEHPAYVENTRAHVLEKLGRINDAIIQWKQIKEKFPEMRLVAERFIYDLEKQEKDAIKQNP
ncbi:MAG TPA: hypothetical protein PLL89_03095 [bacterium]|nr:hypothetical protein [bacterium]